MSTEDDIAALQRDVRELKDRQAVLDCIAAHARGCDRHDLDVIGGTYHPDAIDEHGFTTNTGPEYGPWANATHAATSEVHTHNITTHACEIDGDEAHAESYVIVVLLSSDGRTAEIHQRSLRRSPRTSRWRVADRAAPIDGRSDVHRRRFGVAILVLQSAGLPQGNSRSTRSRVRAPVVAVVRSR